MAGCGYQASVHGLRATYPPVRMGAMLSDSNGHLEWPAVNGRRIILQWEPFTPDSGKFPGTVSVTYDLRIWDARTGNPGRLIYERTGLPMPRHRLETTLKTNTRCFWSVRARIRGNGETRLTDWSHSLHPYRTFQNVNMPGEIPSEQYYRFVVRGFGEYSMLPRRGGDLDWR